MRFGLALPHYDGSFAGRPASWEAVAEVARAAEASGFDSVWVSDHLFLDWSKYGGSDDVQGSLECFTTLSALAALTDRVRIGSLTACNDLRNPGLLAKMAATIDLLSQGRLDLGIGAGWYEPEYRAAGIAFDRPGIRIARLGEALQIIGRLLAGEELVFKGDHYTLDGAIVRPGPHQDPRPPLWVGGKGDRLLETVARHADGWNFSWLTDVETYRARKAAADQACERTGRDPATLRCSVGLYLFTGTDEADARRRFERLAQGTPKGVMQTLCGGAGVSWESFRSTRFAGTTAEVVDRLGLLAELGVEEVIVGLGAMPFHMGDIEDVALVGAEIAPALR